MIEKKSLLSSAEELRRKVEEHQRLLLAATEDLDSEGFLDPCPFLNNPHERKLRDVIIEAIAVLEDTRKSFKSKQLEVLRKKLTRVLAEVSLFDRYETCFRAKVRKKLTGPLAEDP